MERLVQLQSLVASDARRMHVLGLVRALGLPVKNQARMHLRNGDRPYQSATDAMRYWPETATGSWSTRRIIVSTCIRPCGAKQDDLRKVGLQFVPGTWKLSDSGELAVTVGVGGRQLETQGKVQWSDGQMTWLDKNGRVQQRAAGKYEGPLPPAC